MGAETWIKLLFTYGPYAMVLLLIVVVESKLRRARKDATEQEKRRLFDALYISNWVLIFGVVIFSLYAWSRVNLTGEYAITGRIENLTGSETVFTSTANLFLHRIYLPGGSSDYEWRLITPSKLPEGEKITFTFDRSSCNGGEHPNNRFNLAIQPSFYDKEVVILYFRSDDRLVFRHDGRETDLQWEAESRPPKAPLTEQTGLVRPVVFSSDGPPNSLQAAKSADYFAKTLESPDAIIRRNARAELAQSGEAMLPWIESVLNDPKSSYRLRIGVITALNLMTTAPAGKMRTSTISSIRNAGADPDEALNSAANGFLSKYASELFTRSGYPVLVYEHQAFGGRAQGFRPGVYRNDKRQLGGLPDDTASSVQVAAGHSVRLCENETGGKGGGHCEEFGPGPHQLKPYSDGGAADAVSFVQVTSSLIQTTTRRAPARPPPARKPQAVNSARIIGLRCG